MIGGVNLEQSQGHCSADMCPDINMLTDIDSDSSDGSSMDSMTTISDSEEASWFTTLHGRRFHAMPSLYCLPHDDFELARLNLQHYMLKLVQDDCNYLPPMREVLDRRTGGIVKRVLDIGSGSGIWVEEMCGEFPNVRFIGVDIVPTATRYPPPNGRFECYDIEQDGLRNADDSVDIVHVRYTSGFIRNVPSLLADIGRVLKLGGLIVLVEMDPDVRLASGESLATGAPVFHEFWDSVLTACRDVSGIDLTIASKLQGLLAQSGRFANVNLRTHVAPIGPWRQDPRLQQVGEITRYLWKQAAISSLSFVLLNSGRTGQQVKAMVDRFINFLDNLGDTQLLTSFHTICAVKRF